MKERKILDIIQRAKVDPALSLVGHLQALPYMADR
jgi:hypothetical protein